MGRDAGQEGCPARIDGLPERYPHRSLPRQYVAEVSLRTQELHRRLGKYSQRCAAVHDK